MDQSPFILAHLSDVHLGPLPFVPPRLMNAKRLAGMLNWYAKRRHIHNPAAAARIAGDMAVATASHIVVSGDLTNLGTPREVRNAAQWLARFGSADRVTVIPGNHDIYSTINGRNLGPAGLAAWQAYFTPSSDGGGGIELAAGDSPFPFVRVLGGGTIALIALNSAVETPPLVATGQLGAVQLRLVAEALDAAAARGLIRVVVLHHPPLPGVTRPHHELTDAPALMDVFRTHGADLVLHGHNHRRMINWIAGATGPIPCVGVPSASANHVGNHAGQHDDLARVHIYEILRKPAADGARITLRARGLQHPGGPVVDLERLDLVPPADMSRPRSDGLTHVADPRAIP